MITKEMDVVTGEGYVSSCPIYYAGDEQNPEVCYFTVNSFKSEKSIRVCAYDLLAANVHKYIDNGSHVLISGQWKDGVFVTRDVKFLPRKSN